jgi:hypothetical protein
MPDAVTSATAERFVMKSRPKSYSLGGVLGADERGRVDGAGSIQVGNSVKLLPKAKKSH